MARTDTTRRTILVCLLLLASTLVTFWPVIHADFVNYDDDNYVTENSHVTSGLTQQNMVWSVTAFHASNWHPLTWVSHMVDVQLYGMNPVGHHITNLVLHGINTLLLFLLLKAMTGAFWRSACVAALFAVHPLHVESVAWVSERKDVLSGFFGLLCLMAYVRYARVAKVPAKAHALCETGSANIPSTKLPKKAETAESSRSWIIPYLLTLMLFALGIMSKPMLVTWPCVMLLLDCWPLERLQLAELKTQTAKVTLLIIEKIPFFIFIGISSVLTYQAQHHGGAVMSLESLPFSLRLPNALVSYARYLGKIIWPEGLAVFYPYPQQWPAWQIACACALLICFSIILVRLAKRFPYLFVGWFWFLGTLVPVIGLLQVGLQSMADRYVYLPIVGLLIMAIWGFAELANTRKLSNAVVTAAAIAVVLCYASVARIQVIYWANSETLFEHALVVTRDNAVAHHNLGLAQAGQHRFQSAIAHFNEAIRIMPEFSRVRNNLGFTLFTIGRTDEAIAQYAEALRISPEIATAHNNMANALLKKGQISEALEHYAQAVRLSPTFHEAHYDFAIALTEQGRTDDAAFQYSEALRIKPDYAPAQNNWGVMLIKQGRFDEGAEHCAAALKIKPDFGEAAFNLATAAMNSGKFAEAASAYSRAIRINPNFVPAHYGLGVALEEQGKDDEAIKSYSEVVRLNSNHPDAHDKLGMALARQGKLDSATSHVEIACNARPQEPIFHRHLAALLSARGRTKQAIAEYQIALQLDLNHPETLNNLAWILSVDPEATLRDGAQAVRLAEKACELTQNKQPMLLGTLAAAYAEAGRFTDAINTGEKARDLAAELGQKEVAEKNRKLIELYRSGKPFHEAAEPAKEQPKG
jgi:Flp pilus assembly protein TadD